MPILSGDVPSQMIPQIRAGFLEAIREQNPLWQQVANTANITGASEELVDLGATPMPRESKGGAPTSEFIERAMLVTPKDWDITLSVSRNAINDNHIGNLMQRVQMAGANFNEHLNAMVFKALNAGDADTYGLCYDGQYFFDSDHADKGAAYTTAQANKATSVLTPTVFDTIVTNAALLKDDQGEFTNFQFDTLVVPPALRNMATQITVNPNLAGTANNDINAYAGQYKLIVVPWLDSTAWIVLCTNKPIKPIIVVMREAPSLVDVWRDPAAPQGGLTFFKFFARYNVFYGHWLLAYMGNT